MASVNPYMFEPTYSNEEIVNIEATEVANRNRAVNFIGRAGNTDWCKCGLCQSKETDEKSICCREFVKIDVVRQFLDCIIIHGSFDSVARKLDILNMAKHNYILQTKCKEMKKKLQCNSNRLWRHIAYRSFECWINSWVSLGKNTFIYTSILIIHLILFNNIDDNL